MAKRGLPASWEALPLMSEAAFFTIERGRSSRSIVSSKNRPRKEYRFESDGGDAGERDQRSGVPEESGEIAVVSPQKRRFLRSIQPAITHAPQ